MTALELTAAEEAAYDLEVAEVGERAVEWLDHYQTATLYSSLDARNLVADPDDDPDHPARARLRAAGVDAGLR